jgi:hypothetical protein
MQDTDMDMPLADGPLKLKIYTPTASSESESPRAATTSSTGSDGHELVTKRREDVTPEIAVRLTTSRPRTT